MRLLLHHAAEDLLAETVDSSRSGDSISLTIRFRPLRLDDLVAGSIREGMRLCGMLIVINIGGQNAPGIIPLAIKDVFSTIQDIGKIKLENSRREGEGNWHPDRNWWCNGLNLLERHGD
ncbi:unnamed protein product [Lupinus luteus]|uniref:Uncharacterized protein n=1 Tax=Lupinus luteus TaxID=3873 RepID=A0AAV1W7A9_LUPLU